MAGGGTPVGWYRDRRVLITGGLGFVGTNLSSTLVDLGAHVTVTTTRPSPPAATASDNVTIVRADLRDTEAMRPLVAEAEVVFNLAGRSGATRSMEDPWEDLDVNCRGQLVLLEAARRLNPGLKIVYPGSRLEYGAVTTLPVDEDQPTQPLSIHGAHKLLAEKYHLLYHRIYGLGTTVFRITNPYGGGQPRGRRDYGIVNRFIELALDDETLPIYGEGRQLRDYIFIGDLIEAMLCAGADKNTDGKVFNVGGGEGISLLEMANLIVRKVGRGRVQRVPWPSMALAIETGDFIADIRQISREFGWKPRVGVEEGVQLTVAALRRERAARG